jgi:putative flippase GtrA
VQQSIRYGLVSIAALALLSAIQWIREQHLHLDPVGQYLVGVAPNFAAAIAINFVLLSIWADQRRDPGFAAARRRFLICAAISGIGLFGWEFFQMTSKRLVFDTQDLLATAVGICVGMIAFYAITPKPADRRP